MGRKSPAQVFIEELVMVAAEQTEGAGQTEGNNIPVTCGKTKSAKELKKEAAKAEKLAKFREKEKKLAELKAQQTKKPKAVGKLVFFCKTFKCEVPRDVGECVPYPHVGLYSLVSYLARCISSLL